VEKFGRDYFYGKKRSNYTNYESLHPASHFGSALKFIKKRNIKGKLLDVGCAFGYLLKEVSNKRLELYGCDISKYAIEKAKTENPSAKLKIIDLDRDILPYPDSYFDCITALDVLEHTKNFEKNFKKLSKKLKKGGFMIVRVPIDHWPRKLFGFFDKDRTHISIHKEDEIMSWAKDNKMRVISKKHIFPAPIFYDVPLIPAEIELILKK